MGTPATAVKAPALPAPKRPKLYIIKDDPVPAEPSPLVDAILQYLDALER